MTRCFALRLGAALIAVYPLSAAFTVTLTPSLPGPQPVGTSITWTAAIFDSAGGAHTYKFSAGANGGPLQVRKDFAPSNTWTWTPSSFDGVFSINVVVKNIYGSSASSTHTYTISSRVVNGIAVVTPTAHPLVALFSAPACSTPNSMRVRFQLQGSAISSTTNLVACRAVPGAKSPDLSSMNFYIAGMYANSQYSMHWETVNSGGNIVATSTPDVTFTTGAIPASIFIPTMSVLTPAPPDDTRYPILLQAFLTIPVGGKLPVPTATDLNGNVLWYYPFPVGQFGRVELGGNMLGIIPNADPAQYLLREFDLAGNAVLETNVARINQQLAANGKRRITGFHHEARRIVTANGAAPNGDIITLGSDDISSTSAQGGKPGKPVDIIGDEILVLDSNLQLKWSWDAFNHLDITRTAPLKETCVQGAPGCQAFNSSFTVANDWLHSNSAQYTPWDGNLILSIRNQDWVIKISFANGSGDGHVIWKLGAGGNFTLPPATNGPEPLSPWFSHQHDANFALNGSTINGALLFTVFDDGNIRRSTNPNADSRCQLYAMNEAARVVSLNINNDLLSYSAALGSAQLMLTGNLHCDSGFINGFANGHTNAVESLQPPLSTIIFNLSTPVLTYRSFRLTSMYGPDFP